MVMASRNGSSNGVGRLSSASLGAIVAGVQDKEFAQRLMIRTGALVVLLKKRKYKGWKPLWDEHTQLSRTFTKLMLSKQLDNPNVASEMIRAFGQFETKIGFILQEMEKTGEIEATADQVLKRADDEAAKIDMPKEPPSWTETAAKEFASQVVKRTEELAIDISEAAGNVGMGLKFLTTPVILAGIAGLVIYSYSASRGSQSIKRNPNELSGLG